MFLVDLFFAKNVFLPLFVSSGTGVLHSAYCILRAIGLSVMVLWIQSLNQIRIEVPLRKIPL